MQKTTIKVNGMSCSHCIKAVNDALSELDGVSNVAVSLEPGEVTLEYDQARVTLDAVRAAIVEEGYEAV